MLRARIIIFLLLVTPALLFGADQYYPPRGDWAMVPPAQAGMDAERLKAAITSG